MSLWSQRILSSLDQQDQNTFKCRALDNVPASSLPWLHFVAIRTMSGVYVEQVSSPLCPQNSRTSQPKSCGWGSEGGFMRLLWLFQQCQVCLRKWNESGIHYRTHHRHHIKRRQEHRIDFKGFLQVTEGDSLEECDVGNTVGHQCFMPGKSLSI